MVFKDYTFFSYVFLATIVILFTSHAHGVGLCDNSPNKQVCYSIVYTRTDPIAASIALCNKLVYETKAAKVVAQGQAKSPEIEQCIKEFDSAISYTKVALGGLRGGQYQTLKEFINSTLVNFQYCDSLYQKSGKTNPIAKSTKHLEDMAGVGAYLVNLVKWKRASELYVKNKSGLKNCYKNVSEFFFLFDKNLWGRPCLSYLYLVELFLVPLWYEKIYYS